MSGITNQQHIRNFSYLAVSDAENNSINVNNTDVCFVFETKKTYFYEDGSVSVIDGITVLDANLGAGRRLIQEPLTPTKQPENIIITQLDIGNGYIDLLQTPLATEHLILFYDGLEEGEATGTNPNDGMWTLTGNRITFNDVMKDLYIGAILEIKYSY